MGPNVGAIAPLAVVGMDCNLPGAANLEQFEELLFAGRSGVSELPPARFDLDLYFDPRRGQAGKTYTRLGGTVPPTQIDLNFLGLSVEQARLIDPVHLRFAEVALRAWRRAGFTRQDPRWQRTGVFVGHSGATQNGGGLNLATQIEEGLDFLNDLPEFLALPERSRQTVIDTVAARIRASRPRRVPGEVPNYQAYTAASLPAQLLGLTGPRIVCDAACASSLFAMQQAMTAIRLGRIDAAIVGGATTNGIDNLILFSQSQACSDKGSCPFDHSASGLISSEGYAAVVVVREELARELGLPILGLVSGLGIASDGRGKSLWAPRAEGQQLAIRRAYPIHDPLCIDYLEAHATSTQLGDATELIAVHSIRSSPEFATPQIPLKIGSLKSNLGHTLETAGVAGLVKILLAMRRGEIPESLNFRVPNKSFPWEEATIHVVDHKQPWVPRQQWKRSAVSAFGIGGLNAHLFVEEATSEKLKSLSASASTSKAPASQEPIAIVGRGVILPGAHQLEQFRKLLQSQASMIGPAPESRWRRGIGVRAGQQPDSFSTPHSCGGFIHDYTFDSQAYRIPPKQVKQANPLQMMLLDAVTQAVKELDQGAWKIDRQKAGVVIGTIFSGDFGSQLQLGLRLPEIARELTQELTRQGLTPQQIEEILQNYRKRVLEARPALLDETGSFTASTLASRIAKTFDLMGGACAIDVDDASGLAALSLAVDQLRSGNWELAICGAAERAMDLSKFEQLDLTGKLLRSGRPDDLPEDCEQILPGEGAVILMLERLSVAQAAGHPILGIIEEVECVSTAYGPLAGTSVEKPDRDRSLVRQVGYLTGAHSLVQLLKQTVKWEESPASEGEERESTQIGSSTIDGMLYRLTCRPAGTVKPKLASLASSSHESHQTSEHPSTERSVISVPPSDSSSSRYPRRTSITVERQVDFVKTEYSGAKALHSSNLTDRSAPANLGAGQEFCLHRFQGTQLVELVQTLESVRQNPQGAFSNRRLSFEANAPYRATLIAQSPEQLAERVGSLLKQITEKSRTCGVFETERAILWRVQDESPRVVWAFPGQGSQYAGRPAVVDASPVARNLLNRLDQTLESMGLAPLGPTLTAQSSPPMGDIWWNQLWVLGLSLALTEDLKSHGLRPDLVLGHSFGEYSALVAAGSLSLPQGLRMVKARADAVAMTVREPGQLISVRGTPHAVEAAVRKSGIAVTITHYNGPQQTVIAVASHQVDEVRKALNAQNFASVPVPVPVAYHTSRLAGAEQILKSSFSSETFRPARCGFLSTCSASYLAEPSELRSALIHHLTNPVLYVPSMERLLADGYSIFIEVGPNQILSRLNQEIAGDRALVLSLDLPGRAHEERLLMVKAAIEIASSDRVIESSIPVARTQAVSLERPVEKASPVAPSPAPVSASIPTEMDVEIVDLRRPKSRASTPVKPSPASTEDKPLHSGNGHAHHGLSSANGNGHVAAVGEENGKAAGPIPVEEHQNRPSLQEVQNFLLTVVVDLTGYSPDVIDFDADLEADLGVDSIKKAQVVGELAECFELSVAPSGVTMSDLKTLGDIAAIGVKYGTSRHSTTTGVAESHSSGTPTSLPPSDNGHVATSTPAVSEPASPSTSTPVLSAVPAGEGVGLDLASIERFLIDLVVDQTGYSPDVVDLDADMEGDLGIDSIKQAQLLGEVQQQFELPVVAVEGKSLTSFTTLRSILNFLAETLPNSGSAAFRVAISEDGSGNGRGDAVQTFAEASKKKTLESETGAPAGGNAPSTGSSLNGTHSGRSSALSDEGEQSSQKPAGGVGILGVDPEDEVSPEVIALFMPQEDQDDQTPWNRGWLRGQQFGQEIRAALRLLIDRGEHLDSEVTVAPAVREELAGLASGAGVSFDSVLHAHGLWRVTDRSTGSQKTKPSAFPSSPTGNQSGIRKSIATEAEKAGPPLRSEQSMRFAMRIARAPQRRGMPIHPQFSGPALIVGDNPLSRSIQERFQKEGRNCHILPRFSSLEELNSWLNQLWSNELTPHLFITTSHDTDALTRIDVRQWKNRRFSAVEVPYRVCQLWMQRMIDAGKMDGATVVAALNLGGDFGFSGETCVSPEGGLGGLIKAMLIEAWMRGFRATPMKVIDISPETPTKTAVEGIWRELAIPSYDMEVALIGEERFAIQPVFKPLDDVPRPATPKITRGGVWVVTGGARGITSFVVRELAKRHGLKLHLLGTAPAPNVSDELRQSAQSDRLQLRRAVMADAARRNENGMEAWRNVEKALEIDATLRQFRADGIAVQYHCCDVSDVEKLQQTLETVRRMDGPIAGVIHGAGIGQDARFDRKRPDKVDQCLRAKIDGCINLMDSTRQDPLEWFVAFGSISGRFGANGHTDYSYANDSLAKLVDRYRRERAEVNSVTFHWHAWGDIGMATKPETKLALEMINLEFMPAREGIAHFLNELERGGDEPEVLITDRAYYRKFFPVDRNVVPTDPDAPQPIGFPLLDPEGDLPPTHGGPFAIELNPEKERFLNQHLVQGKPTLPFVVVLEMMAESARAVTGQSLVVEARNVEALQAFKWSTPAPMTLHVRTQVNGDRVGCALIADVRRRDGRIVAKDRTYFQGEFRVAERYELPVVTRPDVAGLQFTPIEYLDSNAPIYHGPDLQCLQSIAVDGNQAVGQISASSTVQLGGGHRPTFGWSVHCAAFDACLYAAAVFAGRRFGRPSLPVRFERIRFGRLPDPGEPCLVSVQLIEELNEGLVLAFQLVGLNGDLLLDVEGYRIGWLQ